MTTTPRLLAAAGLLAAACGGCSDDAPGAPDAAPDAPDAEVPDAGPCGAEIELTGGYQDWDSTTIQFQGIFEATVTEVGDPATTATTAPNGRSTLCLPADAGSEVTFTHPDYLPARYTVDPDAVRAPYEVHGITPARIATFYDELGGLTWDPQTALVQVEVRRFPSRTRIDGVSISVGGATGGFHKIGEDGWAAGATTADGGAYVVYPNVPITGGGDVTLDVLAPGETCYAPDTIAVVAGEVAMTTVWCED